MNKFHAVAVNVRGQRFHSKKEARRWEELQLLSRAGKITDLKRQVRYLLIPSQYDDEGRCIERSCTYVADFVYRKDGELVVEDAKGKRTADYVIKRKLMLHVFGIRVLET